MSDATNKAVFLSYASQDADAARRICDALRTAGAEVWFDQSELRGGDAWDAKIRKQIKECALFVPVISANTQARREGYFRREWKLAVDRTHDMDEALPFLVPVVIDETKDAEAFVPEKFREVQWTRLVAEGSLARFCGQVQGLLRSGRGAASAAASVPNIPAETRAAPVAGISRARPGRSRWLWPAAIALVAAISFAVWRSSHRAPVALSEARQLLDRAWVQLNKPPYARADLDAAAQLLQRASALDPTDADIVAASAQVDIWHLYNYFDRSPERQEAARAKAARAMALAPDGFEPRFAQLNYYVRAGTNPDVLPEAERGLQALLRERPQDIRVLHTLALLYRAAERDEEALATFARLEALPGGPNLSYTTKAWLLFWRGRLEEAEQTVDQALVLGPGVFPNRHLKVLLWRSLGDLDRARDELRKIPPQMLLEDTGAYLAYTIYYWRREPAEQLRVLAAVPREWIETINYIGPKALLTAHARLALGQREAARGDLRRGQALLEQRLATSPNEPRWLQLKLWTMQALDDQPAALAIAQQLQQARAATGAREWSAAESQTTRQRPGAWSYGLPRLASASSEAARDAEIAALEESASRRGASKIMLSALRLNPDLDGLRADPRFQALLRKMEIEVGSTSRTLSAAPEVQPASDTKSVAVLAFQPRSADPENEFLGEAISDELCNALGKLSGLKVAASASAFTFRGSKRERPAEMARQLGVAYLVDGSVQKIGNRVRVRAELIKAADELSLWKSDLPDYELKDMFALQDAVVGAIAQKLQVQLGGAPAPVQAVNPEAYRLYYEGRQAWSMRGTPERVPRARELFEKALALDPNLGRAYAGLVDALSELSLTSTPAGEEFTSHFGQRASARQAEMLALATKGVQLEPNSAETHEARARVLWYSWQTAACEEELRIALRLNPNYADVHLILARLLLNDGRVEEALASVRTATELDPLTSRHFDNFSMTLRDAGHYREALAQAERALGLQPNSLQGRRMKMAALTSLGRHDEAVVLARATDVSPYAGITFAHAGLADDALKSIEWSGNSNSSRAVVLATLGRMEEAMKLLIPADATVLGLHYLLYHSELDPLRRDPRFVAYLEALGIKAAHDRAQAWRAAHPPEKPEAKK